MTLHVRLSFEISFLPESLVFVNGKLSGKPTLSSPTKEKKVLACKYREGKERLVAVVLGKQCKSKQTQHNFKMKFGPNTYTETALRP